MAARPNLFKDIDSMDPDRFANHLAEDVRFRFGNADPVHGRTAVRDVWALFCESIDGVTHSVIEQWEQGDAVIVEADVTYRRHDGSTVTFPVVTIYRATGELIDDYRIFMDVTTLHAEG